MDREYLEDYEQKEFNELNSCLEKASRGQYSFEKDRYPSDDRFIKIQKPVAYAATSYTVESDNLWAQVPFCGSLILRLLPWQKSHFEHLLFKVSEIPKVVDFIKETGRLQIVLVGYLSQFEGLDHYDLIFQELEPPIMGMIPPSFFWGKDKIKEAKIAFSTLAGLKYSALVAEIARGFGGLHSIIGLLSAHSKTYAMLKLGRYTIAEEIENLIIDDPVKALVLITLCELFIVAPFCDMRSDVYNYALEDLRESRSLPLTYQPKDIQFPCEIGKFLMEKLTYAPRGMRACNELIDHYDAYDLRKVQKSLNNAIIGNDPDIVSRDAEGLSEILDNVWNDKTIPRRIKALRIGMPLSMAVIGNVAAGPIGATGGFLAGLGFSVADGLIDVETEGLSEKLAKLRTKSHQANIYGFKEKYKDRIVKERHEKAK